MNELGLHTLSRPSARCSWRPSSWPSRTLFPLTGLLLALLAPLGLLLVRAARAHAWPGVGWLAHAWAHDPDAYLFLLVASAALFVALGRLLGLQQDRLAQVAVTDVLTGLPNRRHLMGRLNEEVARACRYGTPLALLVLDMDWLKRINDSQGHSAGDRALRAIATTLLRTLRTSDLPARWGGDEFVALLPQTHAAEAHRLADRILAEVRSCRLGGCTGLSVSIGVADLDAAAGPRADHLLACADAALYAAKAAGRGRVHRAAGAAAGPALTRGAG